MKNISISKTKELLAANLAIILDVRDPVSFRDLSIPGSINITLRQISTLAKYPKTTTIIFVGSEEDNSTLSSAMGYTQQLGFTKIFTLGTIQNWFDTPPTNKITTKRP